MLIMGFGPRKPRDLGAVAPARCPNCGNDVQFRLVEIRNWFSLFFVPLVPGRARHLVLCPVCQYAIEVSGDALALAQHLADANARGAPAADPESHGRAVDEFWALLGGRRVGGASPAGGRRTDEPALDAPAPAAGTAAVDPPPGWYADPFGESEQRYWDGQRWTAGTNPPLFGR